MTLSCNLNLYAQPSWGTELHARSLRKCLVEQFADFDEYQLGKSVHKVKKNPIIIRDDNESSINELAQRRYTIKRLIRLLHISKPVFHVLAILGKKYPSNCQDFFQIGLPGDFEAEKCGKRIKLPIPVTWETQISK